MTFPLKKTADAVCIVCPDHIFIDEAQVLTEMISAAKNDPAPHLILDLRSVEIIASTDISALINSHLELQSLGKTLILAEPQDQVRKVFQLLGLTAVLRIEDSLDRIWNSED